VGALAAEDERAPREQEAERAPREQEAERAPREQEAERRGRVADTVDVRLRRSESCVGATVELRLRASARTCGHRGCAERRRWRERDDNTGAREAPQRRKKREARTRVLHKELVLLTLRVLTMC
jgi:hypothetical protein